MFDACASTRRSALARLYSQHVQSMIDAHEAARPGVRLGALLMEPVLQGAGGMMLVDPLFQAAAAEVRLLQGSCNGLLQMGFCTTRYNCVCHCHKTCMTIVMG
jgi:hypothetical protein